MCYYGTRTHYCSLTDSNATKNQSMRTNPCIVVHSDWLCAQINGKRMTRLRNFFKLIMPQPC